MRDRLVAAFAGLAVLSIVLFAVPGAIGVVQLVEAQEEQSVARKTTLLAVIIEERVRSERPVTEEFLQVPLLDGETVRYDPGDDSGVVTAGDAGREAAATSRLDLSDGASLTLSRSSDMVGARVAQALVPLVIMALVLLAVAVVAASWLGSRLARPFQDLAYRADQLGTGQFDIVVPHSRVPEAEQIGAALRASARRLDALVRMERQLATHASHELRTPLTALRLEIEDLCHRRDLPDDVSDQLNHALVELDRLVSAVTTLLEPTRAAGEECDVRAVVDMLLATHALSRRVRVPRTGPPLPVAAPARPVRELLDGLVDQALRDGATQVDIELTRGASRVEVLLARTGGGGTPPADDARTAAQSLGGYLTVDPSPHTGYLLMLPSVDEDEVLGRTG